MKVPDSKRIDDVSGLNHRITHKTEQKLSGLHQKRDFPITIAPADAPKSRPRSGKYLGPCTENGTSRSPSTRRRYQNRNLEAVGLSVFAPKSGLFEGTKDSGNHPIEASLYEDAIFAESRVGSHAARSGAKGPRGSGSRPTFRDLYPGPARDPGSPGLRLLLRPRPRCRAPDPRALSAVGGAAGRLPNDAGSAAVGRGPSPEPRGRDLAFARLLCRLRRHLPRHLHDRRSETRKPGHRNRASELERGYEPARLL